MSLSRISIAAVAVFSLFVCCSAVGVQAATFTSCPGGQLLLQSVNLGSSEFNLPIGCELTVLSCQATRLEWRNGISNLKINITNLDCGSSGAVDSCLLFADLITGAGTTIYMKNISRLVVSGTTNFAVVRFTNDVTLGSAHFENIRLTLDSSSGGGATNIRVIQTDRKFAGAATWSNLTVRDCSVSGSLETSNAADVTVSLIQFVQDVTDFDSISANSNSMSGLSVVTTHTASATPTVSLFHAQMLIRLRSSLTSVFSMINNTMRAVRVTSGGDNIHVYCARFDGDVTQLGKFVVDSCDMRGGTFSAARYARVEGVSFGSTSQLSLDLPAEAIVRAVSIGGSLSYGGTSVASYGVRAVYFNQMSNTRYVKILSCSLEFSTITTLNSGVVAIAEVVTFLFNLANARHIHIWGNSISITQAMTSGAADASVSVANFFGTVNGPQNFLFFDNRFNGTIRGAVGSSVYLRMLNFQSTFTGFIINTLIHILTNAVAGVISSRGASLRVAIAYFSSPVSTVTNIVVSGNFIGTSTGSRSSDPGTYLAAATSGASGGESSILVVDFTGTVTMTIAAAATSITASDNKWRNITATSSGAGTARAVIVGVLGFRSNVTGLSQLTVSGTTDMSGIIINSIVHAQLFAVAFALDVWVMMNNAATVSVSGVTIQDGSTVEKSASTDWNGVRVLVLHAQSGVKNITCSGNTIDYSAPGRTMRALDTEARAIIMQTRAALSNIALVSLSNNKLMGTFTGTGSAPIRLCILGVLPANPMSNIGNLSVTSNVMSVTASTAGGMVFLVAVGPQVSIAGVDETSAITIQDNVMSGTLSSGDNSVIACFIHAVSVSTIGAFVAERNVADSLTLTSSMSVSILVLFRFVTTFATTSSGRIVLNDNSARFAALVTLSTFSVDVDFGLFFVGTSSQSGSVEISGFEARNSSVSCSNGYGTVYAFYCAGPHTMSGSGAKNFDISRVSLGGSLIYATPGARAGVDVVQLQTIAGATTVSVSSCVIDYSPGSGFRTSLNVNVDAAIVTFLLSLTVTTAIAARKTLRLEQSRHRPLLQNRLPSSSSTPAEYLLSSVWVSGIISVIDCTQFSASVSRRSCWILSTLFSTSCRGASQCGSSCSRRSQRLGSATPFSSASHGDTNRCDRAKERRAPMTTSLG